ncbi:MAG: Hpt domain-containing protein, partial [Prochlorotrichaceae cyanobacterium]
DSFGLGNPSFLIQLMEGFLEDGIAIVAKAIEAFKQQDASTLELVTHGLKSSSSYLGALNLSQICKDLESIAATGNLLPAADLIQALEKEYAQVERALNLKLSQLRSQVE